VGDGAEEPLAGFGTEFTSISELTVAFDAITF